MDSQKVQDCMKKSYESLNKWWEKEIIPLVIELTKEAVKADDLEYIEIVRQLLYDCKANACAQILMKEIIRIVSQKRAEIIMRRKQENEHISRVMNTEKLGGGNDGYGAGYQTNRE